MFQKLFFTHVLKFGVKFIKSSAMTLYKLAQRIDTISILSHTEKEILKRNLRFKDKHKGQRAFIIVNGPSLKEQDISNLKEEVTFVVSGFFKHDVIKKWQPTYYCILDQYFFNGSEGSRLFFKQLNEIIKTSVFFIPLFRGYKANTEQKLLAPDMTYYTATAGNRHANVEMSGVVPSFAGVSSYALANAIYMGCNPIYLLGFDHDYLANRGMDRHFYQGGTVAGSPTATKTLAERIPYDNEMRANLNLWTNYRNLKRIAERNGIKIYNATRGGYLDVFERVTFESII